MLEIDRYICVGEFPHLKQLLVHLEVTQRVVFNDRAIEISRRAVLLVLDQEIRVSRTVDALSVAGVAQRQLEPILKNELRLAVGKSGANFRRTSPLIS